MTTPAPTITEEHTPVIEKNGDTGIESITLIRSGPGVAVWKVATSCKRNNSGISYSGRGANVYYEPQAGESEHRSEALSEVSVVRIELPMRDEMDQWFLTTTYGKYGGYIIAYLSPGLEDIEGGPTLAQLRAPID